MLLIFDSNKQTFYNIGNITIRRWFTYGFKGTEKLATALNDSEKRELVYFLQTRTTGIANQIPAIDEIQEQKHKDGLVCPHCKNHSVLRFGKYAVKTCTGEVKRQHYRCKSCRQTFNDLTNTPLQRTRRPHI